MKTGLLLFFFVTFFSWKCFAFVKDPCSSFSGLVVDATGKPMADVLIVAKSVTGEQKVITDNKGEFIIPSIPDGTYTLRFEKNNYKAVEKRNVIVRNNTAKVNVQLSADDKEKDDDYHNWLLKIDFL
jgi:5-hydroxyisourate hydrolase-like protein (transthyretin family)